MPLVLFWTNAVSITFSVVTVSSLVVKNGFAILKIPQGGIDSIFHPALVNANLVSSIFVRVSRALTNFTHKGSAIISIADVGDKIVCTFWVRSFSLRSQCSQRYTLRSMLLSRFSVLCLAFLKTSLTHSSSSVDKCIMWYLNAPGAPFINWCSLLTCASVDRPLPIRWSTAELFFCIVFHIVVMVWTEPRSVVSSSGVWTLGIATILFIPSYLSLGVVPIVLLHECDTLRKW